MQTLNQRETFKQKSKVACEQSATYGKVRNTEIVLDSKMRLATTDESRYLDRHGVSKGGRRESHVLTNGKTRRETGRVSKEVGENATR